jgi:hypothetical protein
MTLLVAICRNVLTHDISLGTNSNQAVNVFLNRHKDLSGHVSALLGSWSLVLNMNTSSSVLHEHLGKLHDGCQTAMSGIRICNDWTQEICAGQFSASGFGRAETLFALFAVMEELSHPEVADLVRDGGLKMGISM